MSLRAKLDTIVYLVSSGKYITDNQSKHYQILSGLISLRNEVAHSKSFYSEVEIDFIEKENGIKEFEMPDKLKELANKGALSKSVSDCKEIRESLNHLYDVIKNDEDRIDFSNSILCLKLA